MVTCSFEELFKLINTNLWLSGIPFNDSRIYLRFYFSVLNVVFVVTGEFAFFVTRNSAENLLELTQLTPCACVGLLTVLKILPILLKRQNIFDLTNHLNKLHTKILEKRKCGPLIQNRMTIMKSFLKYYFILNIVLVSVYSFHSLILMYYLYIKKNKIVFTFPYAVELPFSTDTWPTWAIVYIQLLSVAYMCIIFLTTVDGIYCVLTLHICNNFTVLTNEIQHLDETNVENLRELVEDHKYILELSEDLEKIFRLPNLFTVFVGSLEICALGFNLTMGSWAQVPGCSLFLASVLLQILLMSVFGENIIQESQKVGDAAFFCKWYNMDEKSKKSILIIINRSIKPQRLTAYKFSVISYKSFTKIISTSWSYFTILRTVYKPEGVDIE